MAVHRVQAALLQRLAGLMVGRPRRGVVGSSRQARQLRQELHAAANDRQRRPVLLQGEPGLEKDNLAALIHFGSADRQQLMLRVEGGRLRGDGSELFGSDSADGEPPLLELLGNGTLLVDDMDQVPQSLRSALMQLACRGTWRALGSAEPLREFHGRVIFTAESRIAITEPNLQLIRVPPLRVRRQDLGEWLRYGVRQQSRGLGWDQPPSVPLAVVKQLQTYDFPNNLRELEVVISRALLQARKQSDAASQLNVLPEEVFWTTPRQSRARFDLWRWKPQLRDWMRSPQLWNTLLFGGVSWLFVLLNLWLWLGPQHRAHNGALNLFWAWWWPLILLGFPVVGRLWCSFCPFMVWGEISQRLVRALGWQPSTWPHGEHDRWASIVLSAGFALILIWEAVWNLSDTAWLSSCLLLLITAGAVVASIRFEKRFWCRYLCPIGGMNGLFAKLSILELRAQAGICSGNCSSYACFKGGPAEGEGMATSGCPLGTHPAHLRDNRNCVLCLTCAQACPHRSVQLAVRPPAADLQRQMVIPTGEPALLLILAGSVCLHHWQGLWPWLPFAPASLVDGPLLPRLLVAAMSLALPAGVYLTALPWFNLQRLRRTLYGMLPLFWALLLADHLPLGLLEAGQLLPVSFSSVAPFGFSEWPQWSADWHVVQFSQSLVVVVGAVASVVVLRRLLCNHRIAWLGGCVVMVLVAISGRWLVGI